MTHHYYTISHVLKIMETYKLSSNEFCKKTGINRGDLYRFFRGQRRLSELNSEKIYKFAKAKGYYDMPKTKKSIWQKIVSFFKK